MQRVVGEQMDAADTSVGEVMTRDVVCCSPDASLEEMSEIMRSRRIRHIPICEEDGALVGLISIGDLNAQHATQQSMTIHYLNEYIYGRV
jgi:CBS domain-containing protein